MAVLMSLQYIYAGGFTSGSTAQCVSTPFNIRNHMLTHPQCRSSADVLIQRSIELGQPIVFVSINYRYASLIALAAASQ